MSVTFDPNRPSPDQIWGKLGGAGGVGVKWNGEMPDPPRWV